MRLLAARDRIARPWKNGGGVTRDMAIAPPDASLDTFDWRIAFADVAADGPFSAFPGVDRTLTVLDGEGLVLSFGEAERTLRRFEPFAFPGEAPCEARLIGGPIVDLNVMTRRGALTHRVRRLAAGESRLRLPAPVAFLVCAAGAARLEGPGGPITLAHHDAADISGFEVAIAPAPGAMLLTVEILTGRSLPEAD